MTDGQVDRSRGYPLVSPRNNTVFGGGAHLSPAKAEVQAKDFFSTDLFRKKIYKRFQQHEVLFMEIKSIPVTIDKSHLVTIGEKLYTEKSSFVRELVNNAYDADATEVHVDIHADRISIRDNGSGMDENGLRQYFTIGSSLKKSKSISPRFSRTRIGEFGIGKFAALAACSCFEIETQRGDFHARLTFDKDAWTRHKDWHLNIEILPKNTERLHGTTITLRNPSILLAPGKIRRYLTERSPIHAPEFAVFVNGERVSDDLLTGKREHFNLQTPYGTAEGVFIIVPGSKKIERSGVGVWVKGVLIRYESFGLMTSRKFGASRIVGRVEANFLPVTSSRDDFLRDSEEFILLEKAMQKEVRKVLKEVHAEGNRHADLEASRVLKNALQKIGKAMQNRNDLFGETNIPVGRPADAMEKHTESGYEVSQAEFLESGKNIDPRLRKNPPKKNTKGIIRDHKPSAVLGTRSVIRKLAIAGVEVAVRLEHMGDQDESLLSGGIIYVNIDHPLYQTYRGQDEMLTLHLSRVVTKELALRIGITDATQAFSLQADLLTDALQQKRRN